MISAEEYHPIPAAPLGGEVYVELAHRGHFVEIADFGLPILDALGERSSRKQLFAAGQEHLENPECLLLVALRAGEVVGVLGAHVRDYFLVERKDVFVDGIVVPPEERGKSIAKALFEVAEGWALSRGILQLSVSVPVKSPWMPSPEDGYYSTERAFRKDLT